MIFYVVFSIVIWQMEQNQNQKRINNSFVTFPTIFLKGLWLHNQLFYESVYEYL